MPIFSYSYSFPYLFLFFFYIILGLISPKYKIKKYELLICSVIFILFFGGRGFIGFDWSNYYVVFKNMLPVFPLDNYGKNGFQEPLFKIYVSIFKLFTDNYLIYQFVSTLIDIVVISWFIKRYSISYALSFAIFLAFSFGLAVDVQRNVKSLLLLLWAIKYIDEKKPIKFLLLNFTALFFHSSAIFFFPCYLIGSFKIPKRLYISLFVLLLIYFLLQLHIVYSMLDSFANLLGGGYVMQLENYSESNIYSGSKGISIGAIERIGTFVLICLYYNSLIQKLPHIRTILNIHLYSMFYQFVLYDFSVISTRIGLLFSFTYWIIWPSLIYVSKANRKLILTFILCYCMLKISVSTASILYRYDNLLFGGDTYETRISVFNKFPI